MTALNSKTDLLASIARTNEKLSSQVLSDAVQQSFPKIDCPLPTPTMNGANPQAHPKHYNTGEYEVIDVIEDWKLGFNLGNVVKYLARADHKGEPTADLYKCLFYLNREIATRERNAIR